MEGIRGSDILTEVRDLKVRALGILEVAQSSGDLKIALLGIREARSCLELCMKAEGQIDDRPQINILLAPQWVSLRTVIIRVLENHPAAREAVLDAICE